MTDLVTKDNFHAVLKAAAEQIISNIERANTTSLVDKPFTDKVSEHARQRAKMARDLELMDMAFALMVSRQKKLPVPSMVEENNDFSNQ